MRVAHMAMRNIFRNTRRSILSVTAIALAAMLITFMFSIIEGMSRDVQEIVQDWITGEVRIRHKEYDDLEILSPMHLNVENAEELAGELETMPEVKAALPRITFGARLQKKIPGVRVNPDPDKYLGMFYGMDLEKENGTIELEDALVEGRMPDSESKEALMGVVLAKDMGVKVGDKITFHTVTAGRGSNAVTVEVTGLVAFPMGSMNKQTVIVPLHWAQRGLKMTGRALEILVYGEDGVEEPELVEAVQEKLENLGRTDLSSGLWKEVDEAYSWVEMASTAYNVIGLLFFLLGSSVVINTMMMVILERMKEIGTLSALGMKGGELVRLFFLEALFLSVVGSLVGCLLGVGITAPLTKIGMDFSASMEGVDMSVPDIIYPVITWGRTVFVFIYSVTIASLVSLIPTHRASKIDPVKALRTL